MTKSIGKVLGVAAPIIGGVLGGPAGAAAGAAIGGLVGGNQAQDATNAAVNTATDYQNRALNYLMGTEKLPQELRQGALGVLGGLSGIGSVNSADALAKVKASPIYSAILSQQGPAEEAILRNASATGGLRSGNTSDALARLSTELQNKALFSSIGQLEGLSGLNTNSGAVANQIANVGNTMAQGQVAQGQQQQNTLSGLLSAGVNLYGLGAKQGWF